MNEFKFRRCGPCEIKYQIAKSESRDTFLCDSCAENKATIEELQKIRVVIGKAEVPASPVPMLLNCPTCGRRHIDEAEFADKVHHTHACQFCGMVWRPALVATVGVKFLPGFRNNVDLGFNINLDAPSSVLHPSLASKLKLIMVIDRMVECEPELKPFLAKIRDSACFRGPEQEDHDLWLALDQHLRKYIPMDAPKAKEIYAIWAAAREGRGVQDE